MYRHTGNSPESAQLSLLDDERLAAVGTIATAQLIETSSINHVEIPKDQSELLKGVPFLLSDDNPAVVLGENQAGETIYQTPNGFLFPGTMQTWSHKEKRAKTVPHILLTTTEALSKQIEQAPLEALKKPENSHRKEADLQDTKLFAAQKALNARVRLNRGRRFVSPEQEASFIGQAVAMLQDAKYREAGRFRWSDHQLTDRLSNARNVYRAPRPRNG